MAVPTVPKDVKEFIDIVCGKTKLYSQVVFAWMVAEDVAHLKGLKDNFNPLNIRYTYPDGNPMLSNSPIFKGAVGIQSNQVVAYADIQAWANAVIEVLKLPYYVNVLKTVNGNPLDQAEAIQQSAWDAGHYHDDVKVANDGTIVQLLEKWGFVEIPKKVQEQKEQTQTDLVLTQSATITAAYGKIFESLGNVNEKDFMHFQANMLRNWLVDKGYGTWNDARTQVLNRDYIV